MIQNCLIRREMAKKFGFTSKLGFKNRYCCPPPYKTQIKIYLHLPLQLGEGVPFLEKEVRQYIFSRLTSNLLKTMKIVLIFFMFSGPEYGTTEAAWKGVCGEADKRHDLHMRLEICTYIFTE